MKYILAIDQGSSGTMAALFDHHARMLDSVDIPILGRMLDGGRVEYRPEELLESVRQAACLLMEKHPEAIEDLMGMGLANQGESFLLWKKNTRKPLTPVISWQDRRCESLCRQLTDEGHDTWFHAKTGLHLSCEWPALKIRYLRETDPVLDALCRKGDVVFGQLDAWFLSALTGGAACASDHGTACRSGLYNGIDLCWDKELLCFFRADDLWLPELADNVCCFAGVDLGFGKRIPWVAGGLDQAVAMIGQGCVHPKTAKITYGTCCACWINTGKDLIFDEKLTSGIAWKIGKSRTYALAAEGPSCGNILAWIRQTMHADWPLEDLSAIAQAYCEPDNLLFVPAFSGLDAPHWAPEAKGSFLGMTFETKAEHILRAALDAIAYSIRDIFDYMPPCDRLVVDGGMTANAYLLQKQADVLGRPLEKTHTIEGTIAGIAYLACISMGYMKGMQDIPAAGEQEIIQADPGCGDAG
ncbi:MAG: hypothetical protein LBT26_01165, partial [Clostridiales Family XIII bacterium]|nr:hypothetical protein [Clostridiales Family XIII bacterium]